MELAIEEQNIIKDVLSGNNNSFSHIVQKYQKKIYGYCINMLSDKNIAEDASQEIFIKAYKSLKKYNSKLPFSSWIFRIAHNHCIDVLRSNARHKTDSWEELIENEGDRIEMLFSSQCTDTLENKELFTKILSHISDKYRDIIILKEVYLLSYKEIAEILECSIDSVKAKLKRARKEINSKVRHILELSIV